MLQIIDYKLYSGVYCSLYFVLQEPMSNIEQITEIELKETALGTAPWQGGNPDYKEGASVHITLEQRGRL